jgi:hypothetical protein
MSAGQPSSSVQPEEGIKLQHVICNSELVLKEVIGSGAEGKVGHHWHCLADMQCPACSTLVCRSTHSEFRARLPLLVRSVSALLPHNPSIRHI